MGPRIIAVMTVIAALSLKDQSLGAADPAVGPTPLPNGSLLNAAPGFSAWQITYSYASDKPSPNGKAPPAPSPTSPRTFSALPPRTIALTRTKSLWHAEILDTTGGKMDQWYDGTSRFCVVNGLPPRLTSSGYGVDPKFADFSAVSFPDMAWVSASTYVGTEPMDSHKCMVFSKGDMKAWIDLETRFPVRWQRGETETRIFRQLSPPNEMLILPSDVSKISSEINHDRALLMRPVPN